MKYLPSALALAGLLYEDGGRTGGSDGKYSSARLGGGERNALGRERCRLVRGNMEGFVSVL